MRYVVMLLVVAGALASGTPAHAAEHRFAESAFKEMWSRTDAAVAGGRADRSWLWGPQPFTGGLREPYAQAPGGDRLVQYFDKARMEITNPRGRRKDAWFVTNGLLPIELITGRLQIGDNRFDARQPARIAAAGDPDNAFPTYADLQKVYRREGAGGRVGEPVTGLLSRDGNLGVYDAYRDDPATVVALVEHGHGVPASFLDFMNAQSGALRRLFVFGAPVSGAYWVRAKVNGTEQSILLQVFERRVLTYTPQNPSRFRVESGNVGRHYYAWRSDISWARREFSAAWDIAYPQGWTVNTAGAHAGSLELRGPYQGHTYQIQLSYPLGITARSLDAWVKEQLAALPPDRRAAVKKSDVVAAGAPAKKALNVYGLDGQEATHRVYIWRKGDKNPRLIVIAQIDNLPLDAGAMADVLDRFIAGVRA